MSLEILRQVRDLNERAREDDWQRERDRAESNPNGTPTREGVPVDWWRAAPK